MPVYHFTFHAYGTWLPDRPEGHYVYKQGWHPPDLNQADLYRSNMPSSPTQFSQAAQACMCETLREGQALQDYRLYVVASDPTHLHVVIAWQDHREAIRVRSQIKSSLTRKLNKRLGKRKWFVRSAGQSPVVDEEHLHQLAHEYLPKHTGHFWCFLQPDDET